MKLKTTYQPNLRIARCCYNCRFFLRKSPSKIGRCILPDGLFYTRTQIQKMYPKLQTYRDVHLSSVCDNHQWKIVGQLSRVYKNLNIEIQGDK